MGTAPTPIKDNFKLPSFWSPDLRNINQLIESIEAFLALLKRLHQPTLVNFDTDPTGKAIADGTLLEGATNPYAALGITFTPDQPVGLQRVYARQTAWSSTAPNVVSLKAPPNGAGDNDAWGGIRITFSDPLPVSVSIDVRAVTPQNALGPIPGVPYLSGYDPNGNLLQATHFPAASVAPPGGASATVTLTVSNGPFAYVTLHCPAVQGSVILAAFWDDLQF